MAALRIFARESLSTILRASLGPQPSGIDCHAVPQVLKRWSSYKSSQIYQDPSKYTDYEIDKNPVEWKYVERLFKPKIVPLPPFEDKEYPSGWKPPTCAPHTYPYFVSRTRNFQLPVYLQKTHRGMRKLTSVHKIEGDIVKLRSELQPYIEEQVKRPIGCRVNEFACIITFRGDFVSIVKDWLQKKGM